MAATIQTVRDKIDSEGFDYAFRQYSDFKAVADPEFHELREAYVAAADALESYVNERTVGEDDWSNEDEEADQDEN